VAVVLGMVKLYAALVTSSTMHVDQVDRACGAAYFQGRLQEQCNLTMK